jgi:hypothetical protein
MLGVFALALQGVGIILPRAGEIAMLLSLDVRSWRARNPLTISFSGISGYQYVKGGMARLSILEPSEKVSSFSYP